MFAAEAVSALKAGNLQESLQKLQQEIRKHPADPKRRVFLFQLLAVLGQWDRALNQLSVIGELDANAMPMVHAYREAVRCELVRQDIFAGKRMPVIFGDPEPWIAQLLEALRLGTLGDYTNAQKAREPAFDAAPIVAGSINGERFEWLADADPRLGPVIEMVTNGSYYWIPMYRIGSLRLEAPADLRDNVWMPAQLTLVNGGELFGFVPTRYPGTVSVADDSLLLAHRTDWVEAAPETHLGLGQRMFATNDTDYPLMDVRAIEFDPLPKSESAAGA